MKRTILFFSLLLACSLCMAQGASPDSPPPSADGPSHDPELESGEWASASFALLERDPTMCDAGSALYEDELRGHAMREHPDWPIWAVDLALEKARDSYLRAMLFAE